MCGATSLGERENETSPRRSRVLLSTLRKHRRGRHTRSGHRSLRPLPCLAPLPLTLPRRWSMHRMTLAPAGSVKSTPCSLSHSRLEGGDDLRVASRLGGAPGLVPATVLLDQLFITCASNGDQWRPMSCIACGDIRLRVAAVGASCRSAMECDGVWWSVVECGGVWWSVVECDGVHVRSCQ